MKKSGLGDSPFFRVQQESTPPPLTPTVGKKGGETAKSPKGENAGTRSGETAKNVIVRPRTRQGFDVYRDQIVALNEMQLEFYRKTGKKPKLGEMLRIALDEYIAKKRREMENL